MLSVTFYTNVSVLLQKHQIFDSALVRQLTIKFSFNDPSQGQNNGEWYLGFFFYNAELKNSPPFTRFIT